MLNEGGTCSNIRHKRVRMFVEQAAGGRRQLGRQAGDGLSGGRAARQRAGSGRAASAKPVAGCILGGLEPECELVIAHAPFLLEHHSGDH